MQTVIYPPQFEDLPEEMRNHLVKVFNIPKTGQTEILNQAIISRGYTGEDLKAISLEKMCAYIGSEETFLRAWEITLSKANTELHPPVEMKTHHKTEEKLSFNDKLNAIKKAEGK